MVFLLLVILPLRMSCTDAVDCGKKGVFYLTCGRCKIADSSPGLVQVSMVGPVRAPGPYLPVVHCFRTAQWLLDHSNTSGIILAVHHYPEINNDCRALLCNSFLKSSFTIIETPFYSFFLLIIFVWLDVTFHCMLISIPCWTSEDVGTERL